MKHLKLLILICILIMPGQLISQVEASQKQIIEDLTHQLDSLQSLRKFPGVNFAAVLSNGQLIQAASGIADSINNIEMKPGHRMLSGSNGKTLFMAAILSLYEEGHFDLDDRIKKYLEDENWFNRLPNSSEITIRMLMNHTSGLEEYYTLGDFMQILKNQPGHVWKPEENFAYVLDREPLFKAGCDWGYADTNYLLLGYIAEKISGKKLYDVIDQKVIRPYHLDFTEASVKRTYDDMAVGYSGEFSPFPYHGAMMEKGSLVFSPQFEWAGGGFVSNPADLAEWAKGFYFFYGVSAETRKEIRKGVPAKTGKEHLYGLGVQIRPSKYGKTYGHSGWFPGYITDAIYIPELDLSLAIQFNTDDMKLLKMSSHDYLLLLTEIILKT